MGASKKEKGKGKKKRGKEGKQGDKEKKKINHHDAKGVIQAQAGAAFRGSREENFRGAKLTAEEGVRAPFFNFAPGRQN